MKLTAKAVAAERYTGKPRKVFDGHGLHLYVTARAKTWRYAYRLHNKERTYTIGNSELLSLADARDLHREARKMVLVGVDPVAARQENRDDAMREVEAEKLSTITVADVLTEWRTHKQLSWSAAHTKKVVIRLNSLPGWFEAEPVITLTHEHIVRVLEPSIIASKLHSAHKLADFLRQALDRAVSNELLRDNPVRHPAVKELIGKRPSANNFAFITDERVLGRLVKDIDFYAGHTSVAAALKLMPLVATRPGELRGMRWDEINIESAMWEIPASRMKTRKPHLVPLSKQAITIIERQRHLSPAGCKVVFPGRVNGSPISDMTLSIALKRLGYEGQITPHGFRHTFSTIANDRRIIDVDGQPITFRADAIEAQLSHAQGGVRAVYNKAQYLDERRVLMQAWADWLDAQKGLAR